MKKLKQILSNKNTVTFIAAILIVLVLYFFYNWRVNQATSPVRIPYAVVEIQPRTVITNDMIGYVEVPQTAIKGNVLTNANNIIGKYTNVNSVIPVGSMFYKSLVIDKNELPDSFLINVPEGYLAYNFSVNVESTYGNSMYPGNYVDVYFKGIDDNGLLMLGKLIENVEILAVKDSAGRHVFENMAEDRKPSQIIFAVTNEIHLLLRKAEYIRNAELIIVPTSANIQDEDGEKLPITVTSETIKTYIEDKSVTLNDEIVDDELSE